MNKEKETLLEEMFKKQMNEKLKESLNSPKLGGFPPPITSTTMKAILEKQKEDYDKVIEKINKEKIKPKVNPSIEPLPSPFKTHNGPSMGTSNYISSKSKYPKHPAKSKDYNKYAGYYAAKEKKSAKEYDVSVKMSIGPQPAILSGKNNTITKMGSASAILAGSNNTVKGDRTIVIGNEISEDRDNHLRVDISFDVKEENGEYVATAKIDGMDVSAHARSEEEAVRRAQIFLLNKIIQSIHSLSHSDKPDENVKVEKAKWNMISNISF